jgi:hypothetical protein
MLTIYKIPVTNNPKLPTDYTVLKILTVQLQDGEPKIWALVDPSTPSEDNGSVIEIGTGWNLSNNVKDAEYISTVQDEYGYVWHYFYVKG